MKPFAHQQDALTRAKDGNLALFHDCGTGKTFTALQIIKHFRDQGEGPALVVCPLSIIEAAWIEDCRRFTPELSIVSLWTKPGPKAAFLRKVRLAEKHDIYVANYETFKSLYREICNKGFEVMIVDESSKMKNPKSQVTMALLSLACIRFRGAKHKTDVVIPHRYVLTGTPAPNDMSEYWAQVKFITGPGGQCFNDNFYAFRTKYFSAIDLGLTGQRMFKFRGHTQAEFIEAMQPVTDIVRKQDALDLPEQTHQIRKVRLGDKERKAYDTMKDDLVLRFADEVILSQTALTEVMKLRQLTSGFVYGEEAYQVGKSKMTELVALLEEIGGHQVIIWANFRYEIQSLVYELNRPNGTYGEGMACALWSQTKDRDAVIRDFQKGNFKYLVANPASAAHGLTFVNCKYAVYFSLNYSYELQKQSEDRIHRIGQREAVTYYYLLAEDTIDPTIYRAVRKKEDLSRAVLGSLKEGTRFKARATA